MGKAVGASMDGIPAEELSLSKHTNVLVQDRIDFSFINTKM
jgi:hypothetical protein